MAKSLTHDLYTRYLLPQIKMICGFGDEESDVDLRLILLVVQYAAKNKGRNTK